MKTFFKYNWPWLVQFIYLPILVYAFLSVTERTAREVVKEQGFVSRYEMNARIDTINSRLDSVNEQLKKLIDIHTKQ